MSSYSALCWLVSLIMWLYSSHVLGTSLFECRWIWAWFFINFFCLQSLTSEFCDLSLSIFHSVSCFLSLQNSAASLILLVWWPLSDPSLSAIDQSLGFTFETEHFFFLILFSLSAVLFYIMSLRQTN